MGDVLLAQEALDGEEGRVLQKVSSGTDQAGGRTVGLTAPAPAQRALGLVPGPGGLPVEVQRRDRLRGLIHEYGPAA
jgi:hypothetical protein